MMKLYNVEVSGNCYKVRLLLSLLNVNCEIIPIDIANREQKSPSYLKRNPLGEIPVLEDGELTLRDSQAILVYLARKYGDDTWLPSKPSEMALVMQWLFTACNEIARGPMDARFHYKFKLDLDIEKAHEKSKSILTMINLRLANRDWLELNRATIADIACFPYIALAHEGKISLDPYPNVQKWITNIKELPNFISMSGLE
ncbi:MAG: glutathione S-transferase [Gammaproteobacteria bacterium]|nr:glutathione S-transferase [Gammaproteobacteria bacterium]